MGAFHSDSAKSRGVPRVSMQISLRCLFTLMDQSIETVTTSTLVGEPQDKKGNNAFIGTIHGSPG